MTAEFPRSGGPFPSAYDSFMLNIIDGGERAL